jgi:transcriptional regulator with XRE-family HTH domain
MVKKGRSGRIEMTDEGRVLADLRHKHKLSMKAAGKLLGVTDSFISHVENGRANAPTGVYLDRFLKAYGGISQKYFYELVREKKKEITDIDIIVDLLPRLKPEQVATVRTLIEQFAIG